MALLVNAVYKKIDDDELFRVLCLFPQEDSVVVISLQRKGSVPLWKNLSEMEESVIEGSLIHIEGHETAIPSVVSIVRTNRMEKAWGIIQHFVLDEPDCYIPKNRSQFISKASEEHKIQRVYIQRYLYRYWASGKTKYALLGDFKDNGKSPRNNSEEFRKLGKHRKYSGTDEGRNVTEKDKKEIESIINSYYNKSTKYNLLFCYRAFLDKYYNTSDSKEKIHPLTPPSIHQFRYHAKKYINLKQRIGEKKYERNNREILDSSKSEITGPGNAYQIDATIADVYLVAQENPKRIIGRPVLYFVTDTFSRMIVGYAVTLEGPSWAGAMSALYNTINKKTELCKYYGVQIKETDWPCSGVPSKILADNGEMRSKASDGLITGLGITVANASSWRPDYKGIVENSFRLFHGTTKPILPGAVYPDMRERGGRDYALDAKLNIHDFNNILIHYILNSNSRLMQRHPQLDPDIIRDNVPAIPLELWNWGIKNRSGLLRQVNIEHVKVQLMQKATARVTEKGIKFKNLYYTCPFAIKNGWFSEARTKKTWGCNVSFDPRTSEEICLRFDNGTFEYCKRARSSDEQFLGWSHEEIAIWYAYDQFERNALEKQIAKKSSEHQKDIMAVIESAKKRAKEYDDQNIMSGEKKNIRFNRANELIQEREKEAFRSPQNARSDGTRSVMKDKSTSSIVDYSSVLENLQRKKREEQKGDDQL